MVEFPKARLLIVDDEASITKALCRTLGDEGYDATGVTSANDAVSALRGADYDIILSDLMMPEVDGISLLREVSATYPHLVGVLMTGHGTIANAIEAMKNGAADYVLKPVKLQTLLPVLERALTIKNLRVKNADLERRVRERTAQLERANADLDAYAASISHDLRTPLRAVLGFTDLLLGTPSGGMATDVRRQIELIQAGAKEMNALISHLLAFSQLGRGMLIREPIDLEKLFRDIFGCLCEDETQRVIDFRIHSLPVVHGDARLLRQVATNLLSNAIKYTRTRNPTVIEVGVELTSPQSGPIFFVRDNGIGFKMSDAAQLFNLFQRLHLTREYEGSGVGLATAQRIVEHHGGKIWAEAEWEVGATFRFTLPDPPLGQSSCIG